ATPSTSKMEPDTIVWIVIGSLCGVAVLIGVLCCVGCYCKQNYSNGGATSARQQATPSSVTSAPSYVSGPNSSWAVPAQPQTTTAYSSVAPYPPQSYAGIYFDF